MSLASDPAERWSVHRWAYTVLAIFAAQVILVWFLSEHAPTATPPPISPTAIHLAADAWATRQILEWPGLEDPTLFALPNRQGYSGAAWLTFRPISHELKDWSESPAWLTVQEQPLGEVFRNLMGSSALRESPVLIADKPRPRSVIPDFARLDLPMPAESTCQVEGDLAARPLLARISLHSWPHTDFLTNTVIQLAVDEEGYTFSTRLLGTSGLAQADRYALELAAQVRFQPLPPRGRKPLLSGDLTWGKMIFQWQTITSTNTVPERGQAVPVPQSP